jgi:putative membrane protein
MKTIMKSVLRVLVAFASTTAVAQSAAPSDAQIAGIVVAANTVDIDAGNLASQKADKRRSSSLPSRW